MGLFSWFVNTVKKSQAAVVVQSLLEDQQRRGFASGIAEYDPAGLANVFVGAVFNARTDYFNGHYGYRPHKIVFAAAALAGGLRTVKDAPTEQMKVLYTPVLMALGEVLGHLEASGHLYRFNKIDETLIAYAVGTLDDISNEAAQSPLGNQLQSAGLIY